MDLSNLGERFTRKLGPLPVWAWAAIIVVGGYLTYRMVTRGNMATAGSATDTAAGDLGSIDGTSVSDLATGTDYSGDSYVPAGNSGATYPLDSSEGIGLGSSWDPTDLTDTLDEYLSGRLGAIFSPGDGQANVDNTTAVTSNPGIVNNTGGTSNATKAQSKNTRLVNERLKLAEQAAAQGNYQAAVNYANAALPYSKTASSTANIQKIIAAYTQALNASKSTSTRSAATVTKSRPTAVDPNIAISQHQAELDAQYRANTAAMAAKLAAAETSSAADRVALQREIAAQQSAYKAANA